MVRGIRGATTAASRRGRRILRATEELLREIVARNDFEPESVASALFTVTHDLTAEFPAAAARRMGWTLVPLLNFTEIDVPAPGTMHSACLSTSTPIDRKMRSCTSI